MGGDGLRCAPFSRRLSPGGSAGAVGMGSGGQRCGLPSSLQHSGRGWWWAAARPMACANFSPPLAGVEAISGFTRDTRSLGAAALGTTVEVALFFAGEGRPAVGGGGSIDLSPRSGGEMVMHGSRRRSRRWRVGVAIPGWSPTWGSDLNKRRWS
jgi:hypothetical protein